MVSRNTQKIVAHFLDGTLLKGWTPDFSPRRDRFHVLALEGGTHQVLVGELKALFFVREYDGQPGYRERKGFFADQQDLDKIMIEFFDGEILFGHAAAYTPDGYGFFMIPGDPHSNNLEVFVFHAATKRVRTKSPEQAGATHGDASHEDA